MGALRLVRAAVVAAVAPFALGALAFTALPASGCDDGNTLLLCGEIPGGGCPQGRGGSCDDAVCAGLYDCVEGKWTLTVDCSADGGTSSTSSTGAGADAAADAACTPVAISHEGELIGCKGALQEPDCPAAVIDDACAESVCLTGCTDFFLCVYDMDQANKRSWSAVAYCDEDGQLVVGP
jgi:hypothetical protein